MRHTLQRQLKQTEKLQVPPEIYCIVTDTARRELFNKGLIAHVSLDEACAFLTEELDEDSPISVALEQDAVHILTDTLRLVCIRDPHFPALVIKTVHQPYQAVLEQQRKYTISPRYEWQFTSSIGPNTFPSPLLGSLHTTLDTFFEQLSDHAQQRQTERKQKSERREFTKLWHAVLDLQKAQLDAVPRLFYGKVTNDENVATFNAQIAELREHITPYSKFWKALTIEVATIDAFQGRDCDIVLYCTVRSNKELRLGFLKDWRRLNVALSRAKQLLMIVGDMLTLERGRAGQSGNPYQELVSYLRKNPQDCLIENLELEVSRG